MKKEKHFRILPDFMIRTAMLPLESINEIKTGDEFLTSLEKFIDEGVMGEAILVASSSLSNMLLFASVLSYFLLFVFLKMLIFLILKHR